MNKNTYKAILLIGLFLLVLVLAFFDWEYTKEPEQIACTMEAKLCPDGSAVGRVPPLCEFTPCPQAVPGTEGWLTFNNTEQQVSFKYPEKLTTTYITVALGDAQWPPKILLTDGPIDCSDQPGQEGMLPIHRFTNSLGYCVEVLNEGAAGSTYTTYTYYKQFKNYLAAFTFTLRYPQCLNYDEPQQSACLQEQKTFSVDELADKIFKTIKQN